MSVLDRVLGRQDIAETTTTGDIAPVMGTVPATRSIKRPKLAREISKKNHRSDLVKVLGRTVESEQGEYEEENEHGDDSIIPDDAKEIDKGSMAVSGIDLKEPTFTKRSPDSPQDEEDKLLSPRAALVAPDVTPDSMTEIDPSDVPGPSGSTFRAADAEPPATAPAAPAALGGQTDAFTTAMDTVLGRQRPTAVPRSADGNVPPPAMESATPAISPEAAAAMFSSGPVDPLKQGQPMPEPKAADAKQVCEAFRRFCG
jgi:hypothetical protein